MSSSRRATAFDAMIGANIRRARVQRGMTQATVAAALGISLQAIAKYEAGVSRIPASRLVEIADATGFSPSALCQRGLEGAAAIEDAEVSALVRDYARLSRSKKRAVRTFISSLLGSVSAAAP